MARVVTGLPSQVYATTAASPAFGHANLLTRSVMAVVVAAVVVVVLVEVEVVMVVLLVVGTVAATINALGVRRPRLARTRPKRTTARPFTGAPSATVEQRRTQRSLIRRNRKLMHRRPRISHFFRILWLGTLALDLPPCRKIFGIFSQCTFLDSSLVLPWRPVCSRQFPSKPFWWSAPL